MIRTSGLLPKLLQSIAGLILGVTLSNAAIGASLLPSRTESKSDQTNQKRNDPSLFSISGVWTGTVGKQQIVVTFFQGTGTYFYSKYLKPIQLQWSGDGRTWTVHESKGAVENNVSTATWELTKLSNEEMSGTWSDKNGHDAHPIRLIRFKGISVGGALDEELGRPEAFSQKIAVGNATSIFGRPYRVLSAAKGHVQSVELLDDSPATRRINSLLRNGLLMEVANYLSCSSPQETGRGTSKDRDYAAEITISYWDDHWVQFDAQNSGDCGGAHPFAGHDVSTWDLIAGKQVYVWTWIANSRNKDASPEFDSCYCSYHAPAELNRLIVKKAVEQREAFKFDSEDEKVCTEAIKANVEYQVSLGKRGLLFNHSFPHVIQACEGGVEIGYDALWRFLTPSGKKAVKVLMNTSTK